MKYGENPSHYVRCAVNIGMNAKKYFNLPPCMVGDIERFFAIPFLAKRRNEEDKDYYAYKIRDELMDALKEIMEIKKENCDREWMKAVIEYDILPMLNEYWFDEPSKVSHWGNILRNIFSNDNR